MRQFILTYHGGKTPRTPEEKEKGMARWQIWANTLKDALLNPGTPVGITKVLTKDGVSAAPSPHPLLGFTIVEAADMETALDLVKDCPHITEYGGTLELSEMMPLQEY